MRKAMKSKEVVEHLKDFRLLPVFVVFSMAAGILIGKFYGISNYELTPPLEAIRSLLKGTYTFALPNTLALGVVAGLFLMMYPSMTNIRPRDLGFAFRSGKPLFIVLFFNFAVAPFWMLFLANTFLQRGSDMHTALVLYGLAPCIAMVIVFTFLAQGNNALALVLVAVNSVMQMILIPVYAYFLLGKTNFDVFLVGKSVVLYLGLPLLAGFLTRKYGVQKWGEEKFETFLGNLHALAIAGLLFTLVVMFALKGDLILKNPAFIVRMALPMTLFFWSMFGVVYFVSRKLGLNYEDAVACAFNSTGRDFEIAIAIAITAFNPAVALATVVGPLIEVPVMLALVAFAKRTCHWFTECSAGLPQCERCDAAFAEKTA